MAPRVLISDKLSDAAVKIFRDRGLEVDFEPDLGKDKDRLLSVIGDYDGLAIRSATKVTAKLLGGAGRLRAVGRAGIGVDNIDIPAATARGVIVMNTPFGNSITTAEHAITLMMALARQIPAADVSTRAGKWEKSKFLGVEITGKTLGLIGCGNIGAIVAERALGLKMKVVAYDPFLTADRAAELGVERIDLDALFARADFISLHTPLTDKTRGIISAGAIANMKDGVRLINCARGGLVDEEALAAALHSGKVAAAAFDVFVDEPARENVLFAAPNMICTPHLGAATVEAQENVALQVAEQMSDYLLTGAISNAINFPSITAEEAPKLRPYCDLAEHLGSFAGQLTQTGLCEIRIEFVGEAAELNTRALTAAAVAGVLRPLLDDVNMVNAPVVAQSRGIAVEEVRRSKDGAYGSYIRLTLVTDRQQRSVAGTVYSDGRPRIIQVKGIDMDAAFAPQMLYVTNVDKPGFIGSLGMALAEGDVNIASFALGREAEGGNAIALVEVDERLDDDTLAKVAGLKNVVQAARLAF